jgi:signal transduction histidine kinase
MPIPDTRVLALSSHPQRLEDLALALGPSFGITLVAESREIAAAMGTTAPDVVIVDAAVTPTDDGSLLDAVRRAPNLRAIPILAVLPVNPAERARLLSMGVDDCIVEPYVPDELILRVQSLVTSKRARDTLRRELDSQASDIESLARQVVEKSQRSEAAIDSLRIARERAEQALQVKTSFLSMVSHELRTPLGALRLQLDRLKRDRERRLSADQQAVVDRSIRCTQRLGDLVESLLEYARVQNGRLLTRSEDVDLRALTTEVVSEISAQVHQKGLTLNVIFGDGLGGLTSDPKLIRICLLNLLSNAAKFTTEGAIAIEVTRASGMFRVAVTDSGPGIEPHLQEVIFEPFQRGPEDGRDRPSGFGLGLALVRELATALGGRVDVMSTLRVGSTFTLVLPDR